MPRKRPQPTIDVEVPSRSLEDILGDLPQPEAPAPTLGEVFHESGTSDPQQLTMPGFIMSDEPIDPNLITAPPTDLRPGEPVDIQPSPSVEKPTSVPKARKKTKFVSRIEVMEAYQFDGQVFKAPDWVNREWAAYEDGPTLYIPDIGQTARKGDYVVRQDVTLDQGKVVSRVAVYDEHDFNRLFMPTS